MKINFKALVLGPMLTINLFTFPIFICHGQDNITVVHEALSMINQLNALITEKGCNYRSGCSTQLRSQWVGIKSKLGDLIVQKHNPLPDSMVIELFKTLARSSRYDAFLTHAATQGICILKDHSEESPVVLEKVAEIMIDVLQSPGRPRPASINIPYGGLNVGASYSQGASDASACLEGLTRLADKKGNLTLKDKAINALLFTAAHETDQEIFTDAVWSLFSLADDGLMPKGWHYKVFYAREEKGLKTELRFPYFPEN
ncbi:MAG: hypothetical protein HY401_09020 [Elusimicrobia bacterium]|nr:hypothetical protein [Elusimicrobiota bacterium]